MSDSPSVYIDRVSLVAGVKTAIYPSRMAHAVTVLNGTQGDLQIHTTDADNNHYLAIVAGFERPFVPTRIPRSFQPLTVAFWLTAASDGIAVLIWD